MQTDYEPSPMDFLGGLFLMVLGFSLASAVHPLGLPFAIGGILLWLCSQK